MLLKHLFGWRFAKGVAGFEVRFQLSGPGPDASLLLRTCCFHLKDFLQLSREVYEFSNDPRSEVLHLGHYCGLMGS